MGMNSMFYGSRFNGDLSKWDVSKVTGMISMFYYSKFNGDLSKWDVSKVTNMETMFSQSKFNGDLSKWDVSRVDNHIYMFRGSPCSLCGHVPHRFETQCRNECAPRGGLAPTVPAVMV